jgi:hypothetical protein
MSETDPKETYDIEPEDPDKKPRASIEADGLLEDFDEDADFDHDPEVSTALESPAGKKQKRLEAEVVAASFVRPGMGPWRVWAAIGSIELIAALIFAAVKYSANHPVAHALLVIYDGMLHTGTGVVAVLVGAKVVEERFGSFELAAARMLAAMGALLLVLNLRIPLTSTNFEEWALAVAAYVAVVWATFRFSRAELLVVTGAHFGLWLIVQLGMMLTRWTASAPAPA